MVNQHKFPPGVSYGRRRISARTSPLSLSKSPEYNYPVMIYVKLPDEGKETQWGIVELQGDLISQSGNDLHGQFIGDLHYTTQGIPTLIIGHHILTGKEVSLDKPFAVLERKRGVKPDCCTEIERSETSDSQTEYRIRAIVKKKLLFKVRPKPIISNVLKSV